MENAGGATAGGNRKKARTVERIVHALFFLTSSDSTFVHDFLSRIGEKEVAAAFELLRPPDRVSRGQGGVSGATKKRRRTDREQSEAMRRVDTDRGAGERESEVPDSNGLASP
ncbi:hypothetical protein B1812_07440 [Methylocystis bryophila]|uniref:Uncharacterized protein n=1 Tax=Methylocystis bryophila TaxID=655015 RepID=A0A1W6MTK5_9HYPH|nr:hypothetical protein B1812_07440 [Methylocystis bryophila]